MAVLKDDAYARGNTSRARRHVSGLHFALIFISIGLLVLSWLQHPLIQGLERVLRDATARPLQRLTAEALAIEKGFRSDWPAAGSGTELARLRRENEVLRAAAIKLRDLEASVAALERVARLVPPQGMKSISARIIAMGSGPFRKSWTIDAGRVHGVRSGFPVVDSAGFLGHIVNIGEAASRVLLVNDPSSRIPVMVGVRGLPAIAAGDNGQAPRLQLVPSDAKLTTGDVVKTSGAGGVLPRGLVVGVVTRVEGVLRAVPAEARVRRDFVRVLFYEAGRLTVPEPETAADRSSRRQRARADAAEPVRAQ